ncbi:NUDIX hydrolase N-terminal domain-containing protein [Bacillus sp. Cr_A10]|uniref:NUDIX hydrolase N-terminal domain-containing protein n=1 Tax=Bacillus sp. Cr_A10 TaxID=3033993 RepID=UPI0023DBF57C|nr:NUDIX hydrolase N-terminal domain-containing protein [Bacillus sp. Cr_A10]MDF2066481.1 NUDIX hydrolase N-terminal domain-containing protein [Bacillus sp. Cr_A10]
MENRLSLLENVRSIAQLGLHYAVNPYDIERYEKLLLLASKEYSEITEVKESIIIEKFKKELGHVTPKVGVNGVIFSSDGKMLLEHRADDGTWGIIGGWCETGESPEESLKREFIEETSLVIKVNDLIDIFTRKPGDFGQPHTSYHPLYACEIKDGELRTSFESLEIGFYSIDEVEKWHGEHFDMAKRAYRYMNMH